MADTTFTDADEKRLNELLEKQAAARAAQAEERRKNEAKAFEPVAAVLDQLSLDKLRPALDTALLTEGLSREVRDRLTRLDQIIRFDVEAGLVKDRERLNGEEKA